MIFGGQCPPYTDCRIDTPVEIEYYKNGGILHKVLRDLAKA
jgi:aconitate hydratase